MKEEAQKILIIDDDPDSRGVIADTVADMTHVVSECESAEQALTQIAAEGPPDLIVVDYMMPGMNGLELCERIRKMEVGQLVPIIMVTARDSLQDLVSGLERGADDYVTKPFRYEELRARVRALLRIRALNVALKRARDEVLDLQEQLIHAERQSLAGELAGATAHELGQPLSAILLNIFLLESVGTESSKGELALKALKQDAQRMKSLIENLRGIDASKVQGYFKDKRILSFSSRSDNPPDE